MADMSRETLLALARPGATANVAALLAELDAIYSVFPDLKSGATKKPPASAPPASGSTKGAPRGQRASQASWNAAARKAVSERMKRYCRSAAIDGDYIICMID